MTTPSKYDKVYTVTSVTHLIPIKLDLAKLNYTHWSTLFSNHCAAFNVDSFLKTATTSEPPTDDWKKVDAVVMGWIFLTISEPLLERLLNSHPASSHDAWEFLKKIFHDNKRSKTVELTAELRALTIGELTAEAYFRKIDSIASLLDNLGSHIEDDELVTYAINGLNDRFPHATHIILHSKPFPDFDTVRSMIMLEEMQFQRKTRSSHEMQGNPSAPTVLVAQAVSSPPPRNQSNAPQVCRNFNRGHCRFGDKCRYLHQVIRNSTGSPTPNTGLNKTNGNTQAQLLCIIAAQQNIIAQQQFMRPNSQSVPTLGSRNNLTSFSRPPGFHNTSPQAHYIGLSPSYNSTTPSLVQQPMFAAPQQVQQPMFSVPAQTHIGPQHVANQSTIGPTSYNNGQPSYNPFTFTHELGHETIVSNAFTATTLPDYGNTGWTMDTAPRSTPCIFLGYPSNHRGYRCFDLATHKIILSRHATFDETSFPYSATTTSPPPSYEFLDPPPNLFSRTFSDVINTTPTSQKIPTPAPPSVAPPQNTTSTHPMITRHQLGTTKPVQRLNLLLSNPSPTPKTYSYALNDPNWHHAMTDEYNALIKNGTWTLVPRPSDTNIVHSMWLFKHKFNADGTLSRYKARLVANGRSQHIGIDCEETFSPVVKPTTIRTVLSLALSQHWPVHQLDVKNAFLHGHLSETVYMHQPPGFHDLASPDHVFLLQKSLYGLKQAPRVWFHRFAGYAQCVGFLHSRCVSSLFIYKQGTDIAYLLLYVDDIILTASTPAFLQRVIASLHA
ncbi:uncharacterized protein [Rutidosis leptorrhynchoides]|uniref:uncharacterized protein n=1 Tax=Rutidosis leptorrhynchoides TaxID=125765 RepID=UPI003A9901AF